MKSILRRVQRLEAPKQTAGMFLLSPWPDGTPGELELLDDEEWEARARGGYYRAEHSE